MKLGRHWDPILTLILVVVFGTALILILLSMCVPGSLIE